MTITGSGFGAQQGGGQAWLGSAYGAVQSWSDGQVVATVAAGSLTGGAQVLQNGVWSNAVPFSVDALQVTSVSPNSGAAGTSVIFAGGGFGASQGSGVVWLGSVAGQVVSWSDTQVVATVASNAVTGIARIQQNGLWSNSAGFTAPAADGSTTTITPSLLNMVVGGTHTIQATSAAGQSVTGLTWASSDSTAISLSTDDPPIPTAVAAGHVTITAGSASADVTVSAGALALGTVLWSNPGDGSGVDWIAPAVPSPSGVADVFSFQNDGAVQAITSDGTTAWSADVSQALPSPSQRYILPDFLGGLVFQGVDSNGDSAIVKLDGMTGQPDFAYAPAPPSWLDDWNALGVGTDGTVFSIEVDLDADSGDWDTSVIGLVSRRGGQYDNERRPGDTAVLGLQRPDDVWRGRDPPWHAFRQSAPTAPSARGSA